MTNAVQNAYPAPLRPSSTPSAPLACTVRWNSAVAVPETPQQYRSPAAVYRD